MNRFGSDVVFGSDAAVLKSSTATYLTLKSRSKVKGQPGSLSLKLI